MAARTRIRATRVGLEPLNDMDFAALEEEEESNRRRNSRTHRTRKR